MPRLLAWTGFWLLSALSVGLIGGAQFLPPGSEVSARWCSGFGLLAMAGAVALLRSATAVGMRNTLARLSSKSDDILNDELYVAAIRIATGGPDDGAECVPEAIQNGVDFLISNGIEEHVAKHNLNIVLGSLAIDSSSLVNRK